MKAKSARPTARCQTKGPDQRVGPAGTEFTILSAGVRPASTLKMALKPCAYAIAQIAKDLLGRHAIVSTKLISHFVKQFL